METAAIKQEEILLTASLWLTEPGNMQQGSKMCILTKSARKLDRKAHLSPHTSHLAVILKSIFMID